MDGDCFCRLRFGSLLSTHTQPSSFLLVATLFFGLLFAFFGFLLASFDFAVVFAGWRLQMEMGGSFTARKERF